MYLFYILFPYKIADNCMKRRLNFFTKDFTKSEKYLIKTTDNLYMTISIEPDYTICIVY